MPENTLTADEDQLGEPTDQTQADRRGPRDSAGTAESLVPRAGPSAQRPPAGRMPLFRR